MTGLSKDASYVVVDTRDGSHHLFKPVDAEQAVERAEERGIRAGQQAPREVAAAITADALGVPYANAKLVTINDQPGVLIEWKSKNTLMDLRLTKPDEFMRLIQSEKFQHAMRSLDALDYLMNNLDRSHNWGNYLYEFGPDGSLKLTVIDHGLTFTSTKERADIVGWTRGLPDQYPPDLAKKLRDLDANRSEFIEKIRPFIGDGAIPGVLHRLDVMLRDMAAKQTGP